MRSRRRSIVKRRRHVEGRERCRELVGWKLASRGAPVLGRELQIAVSRPIRQDPQNLVDVLERIEAV
jgi:hypothetical protein